MRFLIRSSLWLTFVITPAAFAATPVMMSPEWAKEACSAWNADPVLTTKLVETGWVKNDKGRGQKVIHFFRTDCADSPRVEMRITEKDGKAMCTYGGAVETKLDASVDYTMSAETARWEEMGRGDYGPMRAMVLGRLKFQGPYGEAMGNMGPFNNFLLLVGKVPSSTASCPTK